MWPSWQQRRQRRAPQPDQNAPRAQSPQAVYQQRTGFQPGWGMRATPRPQRATQPLAYRGQGGGNNQAALQAEYQQRLNQGWTGDRFLQQHPRFAQSLGNQMQQQDQTPDYRTGVSQQMPQVPLQVPQPRPFYPSQAPAGGVAPEQGLPLDAPNESDQMYIGGTPGFYEGTPWDSPDMLQDARDRWGPYVEQPGPEDASRQIRQRREQVLDQAGVNKKETPRELGLPVSPQFEAGRRAIQDELTAKLANYGVQEEELQRTLSLLQARMEADEMRDLSSVDEAMQERGRFHSGYRRQQRGRTALDYGRRRQDTAADAARALRELATGRSGAQSDYMKQLAELLAATAQQTASDPDAAVDYTGRSNRRAPKATVPQNTRRKGAARTRRSKPTRRTGRTKKKRR